jgi:DNA-binding beta-propeller fold protein YncE
MLNKIATFLICIFVTACSAQQKVASERYLWPPLPDVARIEWLKAYSSQLDIEKTSTQRFWESIAGEDPPSYLQKPVDVKSVPEMNKFFVSDFGRGAVVVFDLAAHAMRTLEIPDSAPPLRLPLSIAVDGSGSVYVLERRSASILIFDKHEKYQRAISLKALSVTSPISMIIDKKNKYLYVSDASARKIVVLSLQGDFIRSIDGNGEAGEQFNLPVAMAMDSKGQLIIADAFNANIQIYDQAGRFVRKFGQRGDALGNFQLIKSLAVDSSDNIYVVDGRAHNISIFNQQGELLLVLGAFYAALESGKIAPGGFSLPTGIDIDSTDKIFVVDQMNTRVQVFQYFSDEYLEKANSLKLRNISK